MDRPADASQRQAPPVGTPVRCPVCRARFRGQARCSRCGADLSRLMLVVAQAYALRRQARQALLEGRYDDAGALARKAQSLHHTALGRKILLVAGTLDQTPGAR